MNFTVIDVPQRSEEWVKARLGRLTGSRADAMLAFQKPKVLKSGQPSKAKLEELAARRNLRTQLLLERVIGKPQDRSFTTQAVRDGVDREADALLLYEALTGQLVERSGFLSHTTLMAGCSLDGHIGEFAGIVEAKAPIPATHLDYIRSGKVPGEYRRQCVHNLWITGAAWCDFLSFNPEFPEKLQASIVRVERDEDEIAAYDTKARAFLAEVEREVEALATMTNLGHTMWMSCGVRA